MIDKRYWIVDEEGAACGNCGKDVYRCQCEEANNTIVAPCPQSSQLHKAEIIYGTLDIALFPFACIPASKN